MKNKLTAEDAEFAERLNANQVINYLYCRL